MQDPSQCNGQKAMTGDQAVFSSPSSQCHILDESIVIIEARHRTSRRRFLKNLAFAGAATAAFNSDDRMFANTLSPDGLPKIRLGTLDVSQLILGSNPFFGFSHDNPQATPDEMKQWYTPERIMTVLDQAAEQGITAVWTP